MEKALLRQFDEKDSEDFRWLGHDARGPTYTSYSPYSHLPACSFDWGADGYAGSSNFGGELLYLSARSPGSGLVMARGHFSTSLYTALSRAQIEFGGPSTFGLEISRADNLYDPAGGDDGLKGSSFRLGTMIDRGCYNYRWPVNEYHLDEYAAAEKGEEKHVGTCQMFSCAKDGIFYQVLRIEENVSFDRDGTPAPQFPDQEFPDESHKSQVVLTIGGPVWFQSFKERLVDHSVGDDVDSLEHVLDPNTMNLVFPTDAEGPSDTMRYWDYRKDIGLRANVYQVLPNGGGYKQLSLIQSKSVADNGNPDTQNFLKTKAYNVFVELPQPPDKTEQRSASFVVAIQLFQEPQEPLWHQAWDFHPPSPKEIYNYVGVNPSSHMATGVMWETLFIERSNKSDSVLDISEVGLIGRSLEKILQVDIVPATFKGNAGDSRSQVKGDAETSRSQVKGAAEASQSQIKGDAEASRSQVKVDTEDSRSKVATQGEKDAAFFPSMPETALMSNLFVSQNVDLKSLFWKVRFLVKVYKFLSHLTDPKQPAKPDSTATPCCDNFPPHLHFPETDLRDMLEIAGFQQQRIRKHIESVVRYLFRALLEPAAAEPAVAKPAAVEPVAAEPAAAKPGSPAPTPLMPDNHIPGESNYFYVMTTIWYVGRHCRHWGWDWIGSIKLGTKEESLLCGRGHLIPPENWTFGTRDKDKVPLLKWYHYGSILNLCKQQVLPGTWMDESLEWKVFRLAREAKIAAAAKLASSRLYTAEDEIFDRIAFLSDELGLEHLKQDGIGTVASLAMKRVKQRDNTRELNPGWRPPLEHGSTSGPWEIHALCHHSRLVVLTLESKALKDPKSREHIAVEEDSCKQKIYYFLNAEGTVMPCWEREHVRAREGWLRSESTAVLASTLLIVHESRMGIESGSQPSGNLPQQTEPDDHGDGGRTVWRLGMESLMKHQLDVFGKFTDEAGRSRPIKWTTFRPPRQYHPDSFFNSLEDTPGLYEPRKLQKACIPASLYPHATEPEQMKTAITKANLESIVIPNRLFISDITAKERVQDKEFSGAVRHLSYDGKEEREKRKDKLVWALYDSLADQEVQHRFLTVRNPGPEKNPKGTNPSRNLPKEVVDLLVYVIHTESAACLANHVLKFSGFSCQNRDTWVASITLRSWRVYDNSEEAVGKGTSNGSIPSGDGSSHQTGTASGATTDEKSSEQTNISTNESVANGTERHQLAQPKDADSPDDEAIELPAKLQDALPLKEKGGDTVVDKNLTFVLEVSSIVISTNAFGDFSQCTIISELIDDGKMRKDVVDEAHKLWQKFIHQPQTARCLVFCLVLGKMCQRIMEHYDEAVRTLTPILKLDMIYERSENEWTNDEKAQRDFELGLWSLDSLSKLQNSLKSSVNSLLEAKEELIAQIRNGPGKRSVELERMCEGYLRDFETSIVQVVSMNAKLERRIELNTRYKEAFSAVLAMTDSRTTLSQNSTVQRLTYLTIAYLPMGLMATIFSVPKDQRVIFEHMGLNWFIGSILIMSFVTYFAAIYIGRLLNFIGRALNFLRTFSSESKEKLEQTIDDMV